MADEKAPSADKRAAVEAATPTNPKGVRAGDVVSLAVKTPGGAKPDFRSDGSDRAIYCRRAPGQDTWTAAWVPPTAGTHTITVSVPDADPAIFTVTATSREEN